MRGPFFENFQFQHFFISNLRKTGFKKTIQCTSIRDALHLPRRPSVTPTVSHASLAQNYHLENLPIKRLFQDCFELFTVNKIFLIISRFKIF